MNCVSVPENIPGDVGSQWISTSPKTKNCTSPKTVSSSLSTLTFSHLALTAHLLSNITFNSQIVSLRIGTHKASNLWKA
jgi:hypothetical protein